MPDLVKSTWRLSTKDMAVVWSESSRRGDASYTLAVRGEKWKRLSFRKKPAGLRPPLASLRVRKLQRVSSKSLVMSLSNLFSQRCATN